MEDENFQHRHLESVIDMKERAEKHGLILSLDEVSNIWEFYSDMYCAGWLGPPDDDEVLVNILNWYKDAI